MLAAATGAPGSVVIVRTEGSAMSAANPDSPTPPRRRWVEPTLTRHESLTALTQQDYPPGYYPEGYSMGVYADSVPGSVTIFPA